MTPERWARVKQIVADALDAGPDEREAIIGRACNGDEELRREVESLLAADAGAAFLEPDPPLQQIGAYRILREIGRGGMGAVYLAERADGQFDRRVAIKVIKRGMDTDAVIRRFLSERQILATLQHPNIATLLDGGVTSDGRPYFVMEYLEAVPIVAYCREHRLVTAERLRLFAEVCDAVDHAHAHLILHRDIKPENILVDASGTPKLLDFGIAKLLSGDTAPAAQTEIGQRVMTPAYASPEQKRGDVLTTASDTYALGLLMRELVTPLTGDLRAIAGKATSEDPRERYTRAGAVADDVRRFLDRRPIAARPPSLLYRARKYGARHWRGLAVGAAVTAVVAAAIGDALIQGRRAERHFQSVRQLANAFVFEFHDAIAKLPGATPARELVVQRALQYLDRLSDEASGDLGLKRELAASYLKVGEAQGLYYESNLGNARQARASFEKALALLLDVARRQPNDAGTQLQVAIAHLRVASSYQGDNAALAREHLQSAIALLEPRATEPPAAQQLAMAYTGVAENTSTTPADSLAARNRAIEIFSALPPTEEARRGLSMSLKRRGALRAGPLKDPGAAERDLAQAVAIDQQRIAADPASAVAKLDLALGLSYRAALLQRQRDLTAASAVLDTAMALRSEMLRLDPQNFRLRVQLLGDYARLAAIRKDQGQAAAARAAARSGLDLATAVVGPAAGNPDLIAVIADLKRVS